MSVTFYVFQSHSPGRSARDSRAFQFGQKKVSISIRFDSRYRIDFLDSIRFGNLINLPLVHRYSNSRPKLKVIFYSMHCVTAVVDVLHSIVFNLLDYGVF